MRYKFRLVPLLAWTVAVVLVSGLIAVTAFADDLGPPVGTKAPDIGTRSDRQAAGACRPHGQERPRPAVLSLRRLVPLLQSAVDRRERWRR